MKKLLLTLGIILIFGLSFSQTRQVRYQLFSLDTMDVDTTFPLVISNDYTWSIHVKHGGMVR